MDQEDLASMFRWMRIKAGFTNGKKFAAAKGWPRETARKIEEGSRAPRIQEFIKWARDCGRNPAEVFAMLLTEQETQRLEKTKREQADLYNGFRMALERGDGPLLERIFVSLFGDAWRLSGKSQEPREGPGVPPTGRALKRRRVSPKTKGAS